MVKRSQILAVWRVLKKPPSLIGNSRKRPPKNGRTRSNKIRWFRSRSAPYGTVYLVQSRDDRTLFKVGFTSRKTVDRRAELNRVAGDDMMIVSTVSMPWALVCESRVLSKLRTQFFRRGNHRGTEWFHLKKGETISQIEQLITDTAIRIEKSARFRRAWAADAERRHFKSHTKALHERIGNRYE